MLSQTAEYALRAALYLAQEGETRSVRTEEVAEALDLPRNYLSKILHALGRQGIVTSVRGPRGGFRLALPPEEIMLSEIVDVFDPQLLDDRSRCLLGRTACSDRNPCVAHHQWKQVASTVATFFRKTSLAEMIAPGAPELPSTPKPSRSRTERG